MKNWKTSAESILTTGPVVPVIVVKKLEHAVPIAKAGQEQFLGCWWGARSGSDSAY
ncbi:hypothetical protein EIMP300_47220 [Escherichia coli]|uniref:2-dehydro-3-deoxy-phosphogluconate aldolase n=1 Tax=Escherichia coli TaxID=562 RepID=A0A8S0FSN0_ECOLX|nr:hypothetical protein EIMP300_47220 [Escherichia coli]